MGSNSRVKQRRRSGRRSKVFCAPELTGTLGGREVLPNGGIPVLPVLPKEKEAEPPGLGGGLAP